jgi:uncharacterized protein YegL
MKRTLLIVAALLITTSALAQTPPSQWLDNDWVKFIEASVTVTLGEQYSRAVAFPAGVGGRFPLVDVYAALSAVGGSTKTALQFHLRTKMVEADENSDAYWRYWAYYVCLTHGTCEDLREIQQATDNYLSSASTDSGTVDYDNIERSIVFVLDASGSMADNNRLEQAKASIRDTLRGLSHDTEVALLVFFDCSDIRKMHRFTTDFASIEAVLPGIQPASDTPLAAAIAAAKAWLAEDALGFERKWLLLSDGEETCNGDPVGAARR